MSELWQTVLGILTSVGVGGAIVCAFSSWLGKIWAQRILAKETSEYKENLERLIKNLEKKNYVSKVRFDTEFAIYRELCESTDGMERAVYMLFPSNMDYLPEDEEKRRELCLERYKTAQISYVDSSKILGRNSAFIPTEIYQLFWNLHDMCRLQIVFYPESLKTNNYKLQPECFERTIQIEKEYKILHEKLRDYLKKLDVECEQGE